MRDLDGNNVKTPFKGPSLTTRPDVKTPRPEPGKFCGAQRANREGTCMRLAGDGTDHPGFGRCKHHGGCTSSGRKAAAKSAIAREVAFLGDLTRDVDPAEALLHVVRSTSALLLWIQGRLTALDDGSAVLTKQTSTSYRPDGTAQQAETLVDEYSLTREQLFATYGEERDRLARVSKLALDAGIAERRVRVAEQVGSVMVTTLRAILVDLGIDPDNNEVRKVVYSRLVQAEAIEAAADAPVYEGEVE